MPSGKEILQQPVIANPGQEKQIMQGEIETRMIPENSFSLYQNAGRDTGYKVLHLAQGGEIFLLSKKSLVRKPGRNNVPRLAYIFKAIPTKVLENHIAISIERPKLSTGFRAFNIKLTEVRDRIKDQNGSVKPRKVK